MQDADAAGAQVLKKIEEAIEKQHGAISFADFMQIALYDPAGGYYRKERKRVGFGGETDFFTATSSAAVFGQLLVEACRTLLGADGPPSHSFIEMGAEPGHGVLPARHPFRDASIVRLGDDFRPPSPAVLFSNELFDAQPFHRLVFRDGVWQELGVAWIEGPVETVLPQLTQPVQQVTDRLPRAAPENYHLDLPLAASALLRHLAAGEWKGLMIIFDYGKSWRELTEEMPQGTARAYFRHQQLNDLLARPGEQDLTCHICWDFLQEVLLETGFSDLELQSQEAFFVTKAPQAIEAIITERPGEIDRRRQSLQQLIYPGHMGQKFQVLTARRR
jgi:SAM-dependent MidA family methyltransferase